MKKNRKKIILITISILGIGILFIFLLRKDSSNPLTLNPFDKGKKVLITAPVPAKYTDRLQIVKTYPEDKALNIPINQAITITFNREFNTDEVEFSVAPAVKFTTSINSKNLTVTPENLWQKSILYTYRINYKNSKIPSVTYSFTVTGPLPEFQPDTQPIGMQEEIDKFQKEFHPDVFLANKTPYEDDWFSASTQFIAKGEGHFRIIVVMKGEEKQSKDAFYSWLESLELLPEQSAKLDMEFR